MDNAWAKSVFSLHLSNSSSVSVHDSLLNLFWNLSELLDAEYKVIFLSVFICHQNIDCEIMFI